VAKTLFHSECDFSYATPSRRVDRALDALTLEVVWLSARRARDYMRAAYVALVGENEGVTTALQKQEIEEQKVEQNKHRDALGFSSKWVQSLLHLCTRARARRKKGGPSNKYAKRPLIEPSPPANSGDSLRFFGFAFCRCGRQCTWLEVRRLQRLGHWLAGLGPGGFVRPACQRERWRCCTHRVRTTLSTLVAKGISRRRGRGCRNRACQVRSWSFEEAGLDLGTA
jgi:hypothetical protein